ncbi:Van1p Ecym_4613 [Eremothecium cymbalariae DBVPG|uniref:Vanadate resistance protein n=1 Tax=Eremothecium cymbalariae (strain CBS 270.75 / DBVPG 7215 / KCTC 17166 / NRRL Y-17582) TaxID=931890 RepID=G8JSC0_ERECY|nr:hypothetical protein Ecym_4613 [Eremothecium cymbalariae DBVPG\
MLFSISERYKAMGQSNQRSQVYYLFDTIYTNVPLSPQNSRYHPKVKGKFNFRLSYKLKNVIVSLLTIACIFFLIKQTMDRNGSTPRSYAGLLSISDSYDTAVLEESEYYNFEYRPLDLDTVRRYDDGFKHILIDQDGTLNSNQEEGFEEHLDMLLSTTVETYDLSKYAGTANGAENREHVLICVPLRNAENVLPLMFRHLMNLTYPHELIDLAFLVSDCSKDDHTMDSLISYAEELQKGTLSKSLKLQDAYKMHKKSKSKNKEGDLHLKYMNKDYLNMVENALKEPFHKNYDKPFRSVQIFQKDFGQIIGQGFSDRHHVKVQGTRRKLMGKARNWLTANALKPYHSWVYWRDADVELCPGSVIEDLMSVGYDVIVPNVWRPLPEFLGSEQEYDLNSWIESDNALNLAKTLDEDDVIVEGYAEYATWRFHLANNRDPQGNTMDVLDLDGVGGVSILAKAKLFRNGVHFAAFAFENHAETEAFGKMAKKMGYRVGGLSHYTLWHIYEPSNDDLMEIARKERSSRRS